VDPLGIAPHGALHDVFLPGDIGSRAGIDDLDRLASIQHGLDVLDTDRGKVAELLLNERTRRCGL
jgi:hypothetical protein